MFRLHYRGLTVWEIPPATQGISTLLALNILEAHPDFTKYERDHSELFHLQIEAMKLAFADVYGHVGDRNFMKLPVEELLEKSYAKKRQSLITKHALQKPLSGFKNSGTVYLCASDKNFHVSFIQSNYMGFGSGILIPETGISLQNRAACFTLEKNHPNEYAPNKKSFHTIIPGFLSENGAPVGPFGIMGGAMQPQAHLQFVVNVKDFHLNPQAALDAPRWLWNKNNEVLVEPHFSSSAVNDLIKKGHNIKVEENLGYIFGAGQAIFKDEKGVFYAATDYTRLPRNLNKGNFNKVS